MLANPFVHHRLEVVDTEADSTAVNRLLAAAVISNGFRSALLADPRKAVEMGFAGESFEMSSKSLAVITSIRAGSLREFAQQMHEKLPAHLSTVM